MMSYPSFFLIRGGVCVEFMVAVLPLHQYHRRIFSAFFPFSLWEPAGLLEEKIAKYEGPIWLLLLFSCSVMSNSLWPHGLQHASVPCPSCNICNHLATFAQTHVQWVGDTTRPSHPLLSPSLPAFNLSQHQGLFQWVDPSHQVANILELRLQHQYSQWIFRVNFL